MRRGFSTRWHVGDGESYGTWRERSRLKGLIGMSNYGTPATYTSFDKGEVKRAADGRWAEILAAKCGVDPELLDGKHHPCMKCGGVDRFRWDRKEEFLICGQCFKTENGDGFAAVMWLLDCDFHTALATVAEYLGVAPSTNGRAIDPIAVVARGKGISVESLNAYGATAGKDDRGKPCVLIPAYGPDGQQCTTFRIYPRGSEKARKGLFEANKPAVLCTVP